MDRALRTATGVQAQHLPTAQVTILSGEPQPDVGVDGPQCGTRRFGQRCTWLQLLSSKQDGTRGHRGTHSFHLALFSRNVRYGLPIRRTDINCRGQEGEAVLIALTLLYVVSEHLQALGPERSSVPSTFNRIKICSRNRVLPSTAMSIGNSEKGS